MLELQNLSRSFRGIPAVQDVGFTLAAGEIVGFLGPNGAGKSTTVKMITGMLRPNDGRVLFEGQDIRKDMVAFRSVLGYVPEEAHLYTYLSGLEYLQLVGRLRGLGEVLLEARQRACSGCCILSPGNTRRSPLIQKGCASAY
jgi:ABC-2 type transport system ATP-binding protein